MRIFCLFILALALFGCDVVPAPPTLTPAPTVTPLAITPTPTLSADETRYLQAVRSQIATFAPQFHTVRAIVATPLPLPTAEAQIAAALTVYRTWDNQAQKIVPPPRFTVLHQRYLSATRHAALYANLEAEIVSTQQDTSGVQTQADLEFAEAQTDLQEFLSALPSGSGAP